MGPCSCRHATVAYANLVITAVRPLYNGIIFQISIPHSSLTTLWMLMKLETYNYCRKTTHHAKRYFDWTILVVWTNSHCVRFLSFSVSWARAQVAPVDRFWRSIRHMTPFHVRMFVLGVLLIYLPFYWAKCPQNRTFGGMNKHFQAKHEILYSKFHIIETTAWIPTKFCTQVKTTKYASWVVQKRGKQIQDGGPPPSWKLQPFDRFCWNFCCNTLALLTLSAVKI